MEVRKSHIVGDVVKHYLKIAPGKLGVTFATDVKTATEIAENYRAAGVKSEIVSATTPHLVRVEILRRFRNREIMQLVNVDLFGEGFDLPAIEVISMARPTESAGLFIQQCGRALRSMEGKTHGIIIDHVGNVQRHGVPDRHRVYTLDARERRSRSTKDPNLIPTRACKECMAVFEAIYKVCPYCQAVYTVGDRSRPEFVDGDLTELDMATLSQMRGEIDRIDGPGPSMGLDIVGASINKNHRLRQEAQRPLREAIALWAGWQTYQGRPWSESYRRFYFRYGVDVMTAQTLGRRDAEDLTKRIQGDLP
jgi:superfamily II DNA or RNA helicase